MTTKLTIATYSAAIISIATLATAFTPNTTTANLPIKTITAHKHYKAQSFKVDNQGSKLTWQAKKATGDHNGEVKISNGQFTAENNVLKSGTFDIDLNTITDADLTDQASNDKLVSTLKSETFFSTDKFPKANFVIVSATKISGNQYDVKGKLTIKGITNEVSFPATIKVDGKKIERYRQNYSRPYQV